MAHFASLPALIIGALLLLSGCAPTAQLERDTIFSFEFEGHTYQIVGYNTTDPNDSGMNDLVRKDENTIVFWYRDRNQDGFLNEVIQGDLSVDEANRIYLAGILKAVDTGKYRDRPYEKKFVYQTESFTYEVVTLRINDQQTYNLFIIRDLKNRVAYTIRDLGANGILDDPLVDSVERAEWQPHYDFVLQRGLKRGRLYEDNGLFAVK